jgi:alpha 1,6-mannosyltransferase
MGTFIIWRPPRRHLSVSRRSCSADPRYAAMLCSGSIYADSDTAPIAHPYLWGIDAQSILPPDLAAIMPHLDTYHPPYVRRPPPSITHPDISLVIAVEWDSTIAYDWWRLFMWTPLRWRRARDDVYARRLEFVQYLSMVGRRVEALIPGQTIPPGVSGRSRDDFRKLGVGPHAGPRCGESTLTTSLTPDRAHRPRPIVSLPAHLC